MSYRFIKIALSLSLLTTASAQSHVKVSQNGTPEQKHQELLNYASQNKKDPSNPFDSLVINALSTSSVSHNSDDVCELAYACTGYSGFIDRDKELAQVELDPLKKANDAFAIELGKFIGKRSIEQGQILIETAETPRQKSLAFLCLAEAHFAMNNLPKTMLYSALSLSYNPSPIHQKQVQFYFNEIFGFDFNFLQSRENLLKEINERLDETSSSEKFRLLFDFATILGLIESYPLDFSGDERQSDPYQLFLSVDDGYVKHAAVTMTSAMLSASPNARYDFKFIEDRNGIISPQNKEQLKNLSKLLGTDRFSIEFIDSGQSDLPNFIRRFEGDHWPWNVFYKLVIPKLANGAKRSLWLDADTIVLSDLKPYYEMDFEGKWFAGTRDVGAADHMNHLSMEYHNKYLNVGVLLFNNEKIISDNGLQILEEIDKTQPDLIYSMVCPEQDLLAVLFQDQILEFDIQTVMLEDEEDFRGTWNWYGQKHPSTEWRNIHNLPVNIIHMEGNRIKPWKNLNTYRDWLKSPKKNNGIQSMYWALRDMTFWTVSQRDKG